MGYFSYTLVLYCLSTSQICVNWLGNLYYEGWFRLWYPRDFIYPRAGSNKVITIAEGIICYPFG